MPQLSDIYQKSPFIVSRLIVDETILVPVKQNVGDMESIYTLNETAAKAWSLLDGELSLAEIRDQIVIEYQVDEEEAGNDLLELIVQLESIDAVEKV
jgi:hypothetical protein